MFSSFLRCKKSFTQGKSSYLSPSPWIPTLSLSVLVALLFLSACAEEVLPRRGPPKLKTNQALIWITEPANQVTKGDITPFLAKAVSSNASIARPSCVPTYRLTKAGSADATLNLDIMVLSALATGQVTLTASCPADATYGAASIAAKIEITEKPKGNLQFGIYMEPVVANWQKSSSLALAQELRVAQPSYSMYTYLTTVLKADPLTRLIPDATFLSINDSSSYKVHYNLQDSGSSYLLQLSYKPNPTDATDFLAVRIVKPFIGKDSSKTYSIKNPDDLLKIRWNTAGSYSLTQSFAMPEQSQPNYLAVPLYEFTGWKPVASAADPFTGTLDGKDKTIMSINILAPAESNISLLGHLSSAKVKNLKLQNALVTGGSNVGLLAGTANNVNLENIDGQTKNTQGLISGIMGADNVGGLVGSVTNTDPNKVLKNLQFEGDLLNTTPAGGGAVTNMGGLIGKLVGNLETASFFGTITGIENVGGIVGQLEGKLVSARVLPDVPITARAKTGGIVGSLVSGEVSRAVSSVVLQGTGGSSGSLTYGMFGGIAGYAKGSISRSAVSGKIQDATLAAGGLVGLYEGTASNSITDSYSSAALINMAQAKIGGLVGAVGPSGSLVVKRSFVTAWAKDRATAIVGSSTLAPSLDAVFFPASVQGSAALSGSSAISANSAGYDASFASYKTNGFWQFGDKANWPILINLPVELTPIAIP